MKELDFIEEFIQIWMGQKFWIRYLLECSCEVQCNTAKSNYSDARFSDVVPSYSKKTDVVHYKKVYRLVKLNLIAALSSPYPYVREWGKLVAKESSIPC